jgi:hypothetical protein
VQVALQRQRRIQTLQVALKRAQVFFRLLQAVLQAELLMALVVCFFLDLLFLMAVQAVVLEVQVKQAEAETVQLVLAVAVAVAVSHLAQAVAEAME